MPVPVVRVVVHVAVAVAVHDHVGVNAHAHAHAHGGEGAAWTCDQSTDVTARVRSEFGDRDWLAHGGARGAAHDDGHTGGRVGLE